MPYTRFQSIFLYCLRYPHSPLGNLAIRPGNHCSDSFVSERLLMMSDVFQRTRSRQGDSMTAYKISTIGGIILGMRPLLPETRNSARILVPGRKWMTPGWVRMLWLISCVIVAWIMQMEKDRLSELMCVIRNERTIVRYGDLDRTDAAC